MPQRTAIILSGGEGTRLHPYTMVIPKPLLPLGNLPIIEIVVRQLATGGFGHIALTLRYMSSIFTAFLGDGSRWGMRVDYYFEDQPLGTAGPIRSVANLPDHFLVMNGDILTDLDFGVFFDYHVASGNTATICLTQRRVNIDFGVVSFNSAMTIERYDEKPNFDFHVSTGIYALSRECLNYVPEGQRMDMPKLLETLLKNGQRVGVYVLDGYWRDIGRFDDYQQASADFVEDRGKFLRDAADTQAKFA